MKYDPVLAINGVTIKVVPKQLLPSGFEWYPWDNGTIYCTKEYYEKLKNKFEEMEEE
jgi:hypothetical protein